MEQINKQQDNNKYKNNKYKIDNNNYIDKLNFYLNNKNTNKYQIIIEITNLNILLIIK